MLEFLDIERAHGLTRKLGASEAEIYVLQTDGTRVEAERDSLSKIVSKKETKLGVRVAIGKKVGSAGGIISSWDDVEKIITEAIKIAKKNPEDKKWPGFNSHVSKAKIIPQILDKNIINIQPEELISILSDQLKIAKSVKDVYFSEGGISVGKGKTIYINDYGGPLEEESTSLTYGLELKKGGADGGTFYDYIYRVRLETDKIYETTRFALEKVIDAAKAKPVESFTGDIIIHHKEASLLVSILLSPAISAEQAQQDRSPLKNKLGSEVLSNQITVKDNPFLPWETGSTSFDDEGHPTAEKTIFDRGVFKTFLYDHYTASIDRVKSTGNASRMTPWTKPSPAPTNLEIIVDNAEENIDNLVSNIDKGVLVIRTIGSWMSNPISGQINLTISFGYMIEKGSLSIPIKGLVVADDFYNAFKEKFIGAGGKYECISQVCTRSLAWSKVKFAGKG